MSAPPPPSSRPARPSVVDALLLEKLERAFMQLAGSRGLLDAAELQRALGFRSVYLARRVLHALDSNGDGLISRDEFLVGVRALVAGSASRFASTTTMTTEGSTSRSSYRACRPPRSATCSRTPSRE